MKNPSPFARLFQALLAGLLMVPCFSFAAAPGKSWEAIAAQSGLSEEERAGARFLAGFLNVEEYEALSPGHRSNLLRYAADHRHGEPQLALCWHHSTQRAVVEAFHAVELEAAEVRSQSRRPADVGAAFQGSVSNRWRTTARNGGGQGVQGLPVTLTWSFVPDGTLIAGGQVTGELTNDPSNLRAWLAGLYGGSTTGPAADQPWFSIFQSAFDNIAAQTGVNYVYEPNDDGSNMTNFSTSTGSQGVRGDVRIGGHALDGDFGVLAYNYFPDNADMIIDTSDSFFDVVSNNSLRLRNTVEHEHCHGLGVSHVCPLDNTKLMEPFINLNFTGIQFDEVYTLQRLYGDPLEVNDPDRDNDTLAKATPISAPLNVPFVREWLGIDDNGDTDYFSFDATAGAQLTVRVIPSSANYLEGAQNPTTGDCAAGTPFDSSTMQDLSVAVIDSDQTTVLASASSLPAGSSEIIDTLPISQAGTYYVRVTGGSADFNQLYRLEVELTAPAVAILIDSVALNRELFQGNNGVPDPGETVEFDVSLRNVGLVGATNISASLSLPPGSTGFETNRSYGTLASGSAGMQSFVFAPAGDCGDTISLDLQVTADGGYSSTLPITLVIGQEMSFFAESFDSSGNLPASWSSASSGRGGAGWSISSSGSDSAPNSAFAPNASKPGSSTLTSSTISVGDSPGTLSFFHLYDTEVAKDGGVLEINIASGGWQDITNAGGSFLQGGYNLALGGRQNPLEGRAGWSGNSGSFIEAVVALPNTVVNQDVQFRWIIGHDLKNGDTGWFIDSVSYRSFTCDESGVALVLSSTDTTAAELADPMDSAVVRISAVLPVTSDMPVSLQSTGSADAALDLVGFGDLLLTSGNDTVSAILTPVADALIEGPETLQITSTEAAGTVDIDLVDSPYATFAFTEFGGTGDRLPLEDFDGDGSLNVEELIFGTDASSRSSFPSLGLVRNGADFELSVPLAGLPAGVQVDAEASSNLQLWNTDRVVRLSDGFRLLGNDTQGYLRLLYSVPEFEP